MRCFWHGECIKARIHHTRSTQPSFMFIYKSLLKWLGRSWSVRRKDLGKFPQGDSCGLRWNKTYRQTLPIDRRRGWGGGVVGEQTFVCLHCILFLLFITLKWLLKKPTDHCFGSHSPPFPIGLHYVPVSKTSDYSGIKNNVPVTLNSKWCTVS